MRRLLAVTAVTVAACALFLLPGQSVLPDELTRVIVQNFPEIQPIEGEVQIGEPIPLSRQITFNDLLLPPIRREETTRYVQAGIIEAEGFTEIVLSLHGQVRGSVTREGSVGVILLPDEEPIVQAFNEEGLVHFSLEAVADGIVPKAAYFASEQPRYTLGFRRYRVLLYNSTDKTTDVDLYAFMTN